MNSREEQVAFEAHVWKMHMDNMRQAKQDQDDYMTNRFREYEFRSRRHGGTGHAGE
tara:strand:+ start:422 stop:589 length:168 start_codon:yes stop_codon:yes gene_type:complete